MLVQQSDGHYLPLNQESGAGKAIANFSSSPDLNESFLRCRNARAISNGDMNHGLRSHNRWSPIAIPHAAWRHWNRVASQ
jgi:hypothetical protein